MSHRPPVPPVPPGPLGPPGPPDDPVRVRRARIAHWALLANRVGYLLFGLAVALFIAAFVVGFTGPLVAAIIGALVLGSLLLAPAIVVGYAVKAAEKEDRANGERARSVIERPAQHRRIDRAQRAHDRGLHLADVLRHKKG